MGYLQRGFHLAKGFPSLNNVHNHNNNYNNFGLNIIPLGCYMHSIVMHFYYSLYSTKGFALHMQYHFIMFCSGVLMILPGPVG